MFGLKNSSERSADRLLEEKLYEQVAQDLAQGKRRDGIWAKALANSNGSESQAQSLYIKYHVQALKDELQLQNEINQPAAHNESKEPPKTRADYSSDEEYIINTIVHNTNKKKKSIYETSRQPSRDFLSDIKIFIVGSLIFIVSLFAGMIVAGLVSNVFKPDLAPSESASFAYLGWSFGFASLYYYLKKEWLKYMAFGALGLYIISFII